MAKKLNIQIADIPLCVVVDDSFFNDAASFFSPYLSENPEEYTFRVTLAQTLPQNYSHDAEIYMKDHTVYSTSEEFVGHMDLEAKEGEVHILPTWALPVLANFLKNICSMLVFLDGGLILHAAGIVKKGKTYVFFGRSESGKSTVANLSSNCSILSDELVAIRRVNGSFKAYGIPTQREDRAKEGVARSGSHEKNLISGFPIRGLFKLVQDTKVYVQELLRGDALAAVFTLPPFFTTHSGRDKILQCYFDLIVAVPCYELHFLPDDSFWKCINEHIN